MAEGNNRRYSIRSIRPAWGYLMCKRLLIALLCTLLVVSVANTAIGIHEIVVQQGDFKTVAFFVLVSVGEDFVTVIGILGAHREHYGLTMGN